MTTTRDDWKPVSKDHVCPICSKDHACKMSKDGTVAMCLRVSDGAFKHSRGGTFHLHRLDQSADPGRSGPGPAKATSRPKSETKPHTSYPTSDAAIGAARNATGGKLVATWTYHNADGTVSFMVARYALADGSKQYRPVHPVKGAWQIGDPPVDKLTLYNLPELLARPDETVYIFEGEKAADAARSIGLLATTSAHGAGSAERTDWTPLTARNTVASPDNDVAGKGFAEKVARLLVQLDPPARVRVVHLPDLPEHGDIVEYIEARDGAEPAAIRESIERLAAQTSGVNPVDLVDGPILVCMGDVEARKVDWLWPGRIPRGRITMLVGRPGEGKSFLTTDIAARVSTGSPWPDRCGDAPKGMVLLISAEDDPGDTIRPRLDAHYANAGNIHLLTLVRGRDANGKPQENPFTLNDVAALETALRQHPDCKLIVVDPVGSFLGGKVDPNRDNAVRSVLAPVARLAEKYGAAVLVVMHRRKSPGDSADSMALGSVGFTGIARAVWHLSRDPENKNRRLLLPGKNNLAHEGDGLAFTIAGEPARLHWERDPVHMTADEALAAENQQQGGRRGPEPAKQDAAVEWLADLLGNGPLLSGDKDNPEPGTIRHHAQQADLSWATIRRAADKLGVRRERRHTAGGKWCWRLPAKPEGAEATQDAAGPMADADSDGDNEQEVWHD